MEELYQNYKTVESKSLLKKHLNDELYNSLKDKKTSFGGELSNCITPGLVNTDSNIGMYSCDPDAYNVFGPLINLIIKDYHKIDGEIKHPKPDFGDKNNLPFGNLDPENKYIISTRVRVGRSLEGWPFPPLLTEQNRLDMEATVKGVLSTFDGVHTGTYYSLASMTKEEEKKLVDDHFLFKDNDRFLRVACGYKFWPSGRGIFHNNEKTFLVWVNEEDHLRIISMQMGGNLAEVYGRLVDGVAKFDQNGVNFAHSDNLGYLTYCPTNLGTTIRSSVHIKIPWLSSQPEFNDICQKLMLQPRGIHGEHTESAGGIYDISNKRRLGLTEIQVVTEMAKGVEKIIQMEESHSIDI